MCFFKKTYTGKTEQMTFSGSVGRTKVSLCKIRRSEVKLEREKKCTYTKILSEKPKIFGKCVPMDVLSLKDGTGWAVPSLLEIGMHMSHNWEGDS